MKPKPIIAIEYIEAEDLQELSKLVTAAIERGWQPFDGNRYYKLPGQGVKFVQAVVK